MATGPTDSTIPSSTTPLDKGPTDDALAAGAFRKLVVAMQECIRYQAIYDEDEKIRDKLSYMELQITSKNQEIDSHKRSYKELLHTTRDEFTSIKREKDSLEAVKRALQARLNEETKRIEDLKIENDRLGKSALDKNKEVETLDQELRREKSRALDLEKDWKRGTQENSALKEQLHAYKKQLAQWESYRSVLHELDTAAL